MTRYDTIGRTYAQTRQPDPRIAAQILAAIGPAPRVVNVGAGTGSYEPVDPFLVACEPSRTMVRQRRPGAAPALLSRAEALPFSDDAFDVALASLTVHHWEDLDRGLREMQRVAPRQVVFSFEPSLGSRFWLVRDYFPEIVQLPSERTAPGPERLGEVLALHTIEPVVVPNDCRDGFAGCYWNRPEAYLDPTVQAGISCFAQLDRGLCHRGTERLRADLESGAWDERHGHLRELTEIDLGYRLLVAGDHLS